MVKGSQSVFYCTLFLPHHFPCGTLLWDKDDKVSFSSSPLAVLHVEGPQPLSSWDPPSPPIPCQSENLSVHLPRSSVWVKLQEGVHKPAEVSSCTDTFLTTPKVVRWPAKVFSFVSKIWGGPKIVRTPAEVFSLLSRVRKLSVKLLRSSVCEACQFWLLRKLSVQLPRSSVLCQKLKKMLATPKVVHTPATVSSLRNCPYTC